MRINSGLPPKFCCEIVVHIAPPYIYFWEKALPYIWFRGILIFDFYNTRLEWEETNKKANSKNN